MAPTTRSTSSAAPAAGGSINTSDFLNTAINTDPRTQAEGLPSKLPGSLQGVTELLTGRKNFERWHLWVETSLRPLSLYQLLQKDLPRPQIDDPSYNLWHRLSSIICAWLLKQLSPEISERFVRAEGGREFADNAYKTICKIALGEELIKVINTCIKLVSESRNNYSTIAQYINSFMNTFTTAQRIRCKMPAFMATCILLSNLETELPTWTTPIRIALPLANPDTLTNTDFYKYCDEAIATGNGLDAKHLAASAPIIQASAAPRDIKSDHWKKRTFPEPGISPEDHVAKMRNQQPQQLDRKCAYCHIGGHGSLVYYHLNPSLRPPHWKPTRGL
ncbi:hypothetical protein BO94DRAFT_623890 [Aspergillus sclerotioniger CBS 115572]|uniref:Uncharacterized protein n=1 Tax=Aspergillus sclerotioniger CBS 115572 TaxID=1450535 RepID=A0A317WS15_9EURO|nr:hypothetical protein BO94DRAFT_623890 [Aspergillus sclerotioniger CBS 115572]PWY88825.1 hypothetical protein BO94DRAFT_623890 [Aspergillus sclerotioniger CBS 115572]